MRLRAVRNNDRKQSGSLEQSDFREPNIIILTAFRYVTGDDTIVATSTAIDIVTKTERNISSMNLLIKCIY